ncbi:hypothetical protein DXG03_002652 [Asterophora parasitica]|uniref:Non-structural maintenance of chromosomes element 1 homolog n=1 Tax=Asterophora parasitica TaxID=117018 RepID=A0A9P7GGM3_9AGAR|nr:hypothetical protein DXG03_002652 [Asterophora parasitica]
MVHADDVQRLFLQAVFSRGILSAKLARTLWNKSIVAVTAADPDFDAALQCNDEDSWNTIVTKINRSLDALDLEFRHLNDENTGTDMYAVVNRKGDEIAQMATDYTPAEITYFKAIIELIMLAPRESFSVSSTVALREVSAIKPKTNMSKTQAEVVLGSFVARGWLVKSKRGRYSLSTRSLLELQSYLKSTYPEEYSECTICMAILTRGVACHTPNCKCRLHYHCFENYRRRKSSCPSCKEGEWPETYSEKPLIPIGEAAARDGEDARRCARTADSDEEEDEELADDEEAAASQSQRSQRARKSKAIRDESMDEDDDSVKDGPVKQEKESQPTRRSSRK